MPIPEHPRRVYDRHTLEAVICQLRFPPVLRITSEDPSAFQDAIRSRFPYYNVRRQAIPELPGELQKLLNRFGNLDADRSFEFTSDDQTWQVTLHNAFLALSTRDYSRWEVFRDHLEEPFRQLIELYRPAFFERIGLRYKNTIIKSRLGLAQEPWSELLAPHISAELSESNIRDDVIQSRTEILLRLGHDVPDSFVRVRHGLTTVSETNEQAYTIDADYYTESRRDTDHGLEILDGFNKYAGRLFRWCISDRLYEVLGPKAPD